MDDTNKPVAQIPELSADIASLLLNNVFAECDIIPNSIPLETLESWGNYKRTEFRLGRVISYTILVILVLIPLFFFKPTIIAQRTQVDSSTAAVYEIQVKTLLPVDGVVATLDGDPLTLEKVNSRSYLTSIKQNGRLEIKATALNGQYSVKFYDVAHLDMDKPAFVKSYTENGMIYLILKDTYSGINYDTVEALDDNQGKVDPSSVDKKTGTIVFRVPTTPITVSISDNAGNTLQILLSPTE